VRLLLPGRWMAERANVREKPMLRERAASMEKPIPAERAAAFSGQRGAIPLHLTRKKKNQQ
jgi:hypothetical protein